DEGESLWAPAHSREPPRRVSQARRRVASAPRSGKRRDANAQREIVPAAKAPGARRPRIGSPRPSNSWSAFPGSGLGGAGLRGARRDRAVEVLDERAGRASLPLELRRDLLGSREHAEHVSAGDLLHVLVGVATLEELGEKRGIAADVLEAL